jgi:hypothetical protein
MLMPKNSTTGDLSEVYRKLEDVSKQVGAANDARIKEQIDRLQQEKTDLSARHVTELAALQQVTNIASDVKGLATQVSELKTLTEGQNVKLLKVETIEASVTELQTAKAKDDSDKVWLRRAVFGLLLMGFGYGLIDAAKVIYGFRTPSEQEDAAIVHHHRDVDAPDADTTDIDTTTVHHQHSATEEDKPVRQKED